MTETQYPTPDPDAILRAITSAEMVEVARQAVRRNFWGRGSTPVGMQAALTAVADALRPMLGSPSTPRDALAIYDQAYQESVDQATQKNKGDFRGDDNWERNAKIAGITAVLKHAHADAIKPMLGTGGARWRHKKRGTTYVELHRAELQHADPRFDCLPLVVYQCEKDGRVWVRPVDEFEDGRFEPAPPTQEPR